MAKKPVDPRVSQTAMSTSGSTLSLLDVLNQDRSGGQHKEELSSLQQRILQKLLSSAGQSGAVVRRKYTVQLSITERLDAVSARSGINKSAFVDVAIELLLDEIEQ